MRRDHRPFWLKRTFERLEHRFTEHFIAPRLDALGPGHRFMKPWNLRVHGSNIRIGAQVHIVTASDRRVRLSTWEHGEHSGRIDIGDFALLCPGVRLDSASAIRVGASSMIAAGAYLTDADWHDLYDRTRIIGRSEPIELLENAWVGDGATICKGVTIGCNAIVAAGAVVARDVPDDVIVAGNPAQIVKQLDPGAARVTRAELFADPAELARVNEALERWLLGRNTSLGWLRSLFLPRRGD